MMDALKNLNLTENSSDEDLRKAYKIGLLSLHPDRHSPEVYTETFKKKYLTHVVSYDIIVNYRRILKESEELLNFQSTGNKTDNISALIRIDLKHRLYNGQEEKKKVKLARDYLIYHYKSQ